MAGGEGQSRAAKKRAKQKNKKRQLEQQQQQETGNDNDNDSNSDGKNVPPKKSKTGKVEEEGPENTKRINSIVKGEEKNDSCQNESEGSKKKSKDDKESSKPNSNDEIMQQIKTREEFMACPPPTPTEILFPKERNNLDEKNSNDEEKETNEMEHDDEEAAAAFSCDSAEDRGRLLLQSLLYPAGISVQEFYDKYWEKLPLHVSAFSDKKQNNGKHAHDHSRLNGFLSKTDIQEMIASKGLKYKHDLNVTKCDESTRNKRINYDSNNGAVDEGPQVADPESVWSNFAKGCTVRMLCPHKHSDPVHTLCSTFESEFGCMIGCNAYLTPGHGSQGFAPHYDDIEAFVLQVEGRKRWKVYKPINVKETLPRISSNDFRLEQKDDESSDEEEERNEAHIMAEKEEFNPLRPVEDDPVLDVTLHPGDLLYMPRGWIHCACTPDRNSEHSLHLTVSAMQQWSWADLMEVIMPEALNAAAESGESVSLRRGLPRDFLAYMGAMHDNDVKDDDIVGFKQTGTDDDQVQEEQDEEELLAKEMEQAKRKLRQKFKDEAKKKITKVFKEAVSMLDGACDQLGKRYLSDRLPPAFTPEELATTSDNTSNGPQRILPNTMIRIARAGIARLVLEDDDKAVLYHSVDNSREFHGNPLSPMEFELDDAPALEMILTTTEPHWIQVNDLIHDAIEDKVEIVDALYKEGILSIFQP